MRAALLWSETILRVVLISQARETANVESRVDPGK